jgi:hypothetical protein
MPPMPSYSFVVGIDFAEARTDTNITYPRNNNRYGSHLERRYLFKIKNKNKKDHPYKKSISISVPLTFDVGCDTMELNQ